MNLFIPRMPTNPDGLDGSQRAMRLLQTVLRLGPVIERSAMSIPDGICLIGQRVGRQRSIRKGQAGSTFRVARSWLRRGVRSR